MTKTEGIRIPIITERFLTMVLRYVVVNENIFKRSLNNIARIIAIIDHRHYQKDVNVAALLKAIEIAVKERFDDFDKDSLLMKFEALIPSMYNEVKEGIIYPILLASPLPDKDCNYVDNVIETYLKYSAVLKETNPLMDIITDMTSGVSNVENSVKSFQLMIQNLHDSFRNVDNSETFKQVVHMHDQDYSDVYLKETFNKAKSPKSVYKMGLQYLNDFLSIDGGLLAKYYIFYADINSFKSALLMYFAKWIQLYNSDAFAKRFMETGKRPTVLMVSMENSEDENIQRFFSMYTSRSIVKVPSFQEARQIWTNAWESQNSIIDISLLHVESNTIRPSDLDSICDQLWEDGYEVVGIAADYLELFLPEERHMRMDYRLQLGQISTGLFSISKRRKIPVITAQQLNREGSRTLFEARERGDLEAGKKISRHNVGESHGIEKPADFSGVITLEKFKDEVYLTFKRLKCRYAVPKIESFVHKLKHGFIIEDDIYLEKPTSLLRIMEDPSIDTGFNMKDIGRRGIVTKNLPTVQDETPAEIKTVDSDRQYFDLDCIESKDNYTFDITRDDIMEKIDDDDQEYIGFAEYDLDMSIGEVA